MLYLRKHLYKIVQEAALNEGLTIYELVTQAIYEWLEERNYDWTKYIECPNCKALKKNGAIVLEKEEGKLFGKCQICRTRFPIRGAAVYLRATNKA
jgi:transcription elongation factor Elf1